MLLILLGLLQAPASAASPVDNPQLPSGLPSCPQPGQPARFYPEHAYRNGISGEVTLQCQVGADRRLHDCVALKENPSGERFGWAAIGMAQCAGPTKFEPGTVRTFPVRFRP